VYPKWAVRISALAACTPVSSPTRHDAASRIPKRREHLLLAFRLQTDKIRPLLRVSGGERYYTATPSGLTQARGTAWRFGTTRPPH
jgi:hypothetical protein